MSKEKIVVGKNEQTVAVREITKAIDALNMLSHLIQDGTLDAEIKESAPTLIDRYMTQVKEAIGFTGEPSEKEEEMVRSINHHLQEKIRDLELALTHQGSISSIPANVEMIFKKIDKWWDIDGFNYTKGKSIDRNGRVVLELGISLDSWLSNYSKTPETDKENLLTKKQHFKDQGFIFSDEGDNLIDCDTNRRLLFNLLTSAFPSAYVTEVKNHARRTEEGMELIIRSINVTIKDIQDVERLDIQEKFFLLEDD